MTVRANRVVIEDKKWETYKSDLRALKSVGVAVGVFEDAKNEKGEPVADYAARNEYGIGRPERSFMRSTVDEHKRVYLGLMEKIVNGLGRRKEKQRRNVIQAMLLGVGMGLEEDIVAKILTAKSWATPLADRTVRNKGHDLPLIETTALVNAIDSRVLSKAAAMKARMG